MTLGYEKWMKKCKSSNALGMVVQQEPCVFEIPDGHLFSPLQTGADN